MYSQTRSRYGRKLDEVAEVDLQPAATSIASAGGQHVSSTISGITHSRFRLDRQAGDQVDDGVDDQRRQEAHERR